MACTAAARFALARSPSRNTHRFEGVSDPDDMSILYAIETRSGVRGTLADAFGAYADPRVGAFLRDVAVRRSRRPDTPGDTGPG